MNRGHQGRHVLDVHPDLHAKANAARLDFDGGDPHRHRLLRDHHRQKRRGDPPPPRALTPAQLPAPLAECPRPHAKASCDLAHFRPALDLAEGAFPIRDRDGRRARTELRPIADDAGGGICSRD